MTRILLFLATNFAVMIVFGIVTQVFGLDRMLGVSGSTMHLMVFALIAGFMGSFISLAMSKSIAKRSMGVHVIEQPTNATERWLLETVHRQARESGVGEPEVGIFNDSAPNAFATGMNKNSALVAVSTGLLQTMSQDEVEAVLGHEVAHVYNGDMVTMGLIQGVLNTFVIILSRIAGMMIDAALRGNRSGGGHHGGIGYFIGNILGNMVFGFLAAMIAAWFSRQREFRADAGGAKLAGRDSMINALKALKRGGPPAEMPDQMQAFGINSGKLMAMLATHPPLDERIARLEAER